MASCVKSEKNTKKKERTREREKERKRERDRERERETLVFKRKKSMNFKNFKLAYQSKLQYQRENFWLERSKVSPIG